MREKCTVCGYRHDPVQIAAGYAHCEHCGAWKQRMSRTFDGCVDCDTFEFRRGLEMTRRRIMQRTRRTVP